MISIPRRPWSAVVRLLERDERVFAFLLAVVMVGGLATLGLAPLRPRYRFDLFCWCHGSPRKASSPRHCEPAPRA
jgi:hypothetical protein